MFKLIVVFAILLVLYLLYQRPQYSQLSFDQKKKRARSKMRELRARGEADFQLQQRLIQLVGGDRNEAERLVARQRFGTEGRYSEDFYWSLAIEEVEKSEKN